MINVGLIDELIHFGSDSFYGVRKIWIVKGSQEWCHICEFWGWLVSIIGGWPVGYPEVLDLQPFASSIHLASSPRMQANRSMLVLIHSERVWECNTDQDSIRPTRIPNWTFMLQDYILKINRWDLHAYSRIHNLVSWEHFWVPDGLQLKKRECSPRWFLDLTWFFPMRLKEGSWIRRHGWSSFFGASSNIYIYSYHLSFIIGWFF